MFTKQSWISRGRPSLQAVAQILTEHSVHPARDFATFPPSVRLSQTFVVKSDLVMTSLTRSTQDPFEAAKLYGQEHIFEGYELLDSDQQQNMMQELQGMDFEFINATFKASMAAQDAATEDIQPYKNVMQLKDIQPGQRDAWLQLGYQLLAEGKAGILLLAGGQGTRLGSSAPKGCYDVGLPSRKSLFQVQAERLLRLQKLAANVTYGPGATAKTTIPWIIMTSPFTHQATLDHFEHHGFFGLSPTQIMFFQQGSLPCMTEQGKIIMEAPGRIARAPDGNGGLYLALARSGVLKKLRELGVEALDCYCVDNILARVKIFQSGMQEAKLLMFQTTDPCTSLSVCVPIFATACAAEAGGRLGDPLYLGYCHSHQAQCGARVLAKAYPQEKVGVFAHRQGKLQVVEYSELDPALASAADPASECGQLLFNWSNICMHYFSVAWLQQVADHLATGSSAYHIARKQIPSINGPVPGIKLELFIFDTFPLADHTALMEVDRAEQFAPVKNAPGSATDSPDTARAALLSLHKKWVEAAGGQVPCAEGVEVSPLVSYQGEGLEELVLGRVFSTPYSDLLQGKAA